MPLSGWPERDLGSRQRLIVARPSPAPQPARARLTAVPTPDQRLAELGIELPEFPALPFVPRLRPILEHGGLAYLSGIGPIGTTGRVGDTLSVEEGYAAARETGLLALRRI